MNTEHAIVKQVGDPLPIAVKGGPGTLEESEIKSVLALNGADETGFYSTIAITWLTIVATISGAVYLDHWLANIAAIFLIATRQNVLGLLTHEQVHRSGANSKFGDFIANIFCAFPILISLQGYRHIHLTHHRKYFTEFDPDYRRKQGEEFTFPQKPQAFLMTALKVIIGLNLIATVRGKAPGPDLNSPVQDR